MEGEGHTPKCQYWYYRKWDARKAASFQVRECHDIEQELAARGLEFKCAEGQCASSRFHEGSLIQPRRTHSTFCAKSSVQGMCCRFTSE